MRYDCDLIRDLLPLYHDKAASEFSSKLVEEHLGECEKCRRLSQEMQKATHMPFKSSQKTDNTDGYVSLAKRLRRTKWYWRLCVGFAVGVIVYLSLMCSDGNRFDPLRAAYASHVIDSHSQLVATVPMGSERILYIYEEDGIYQNVDVTYRFPFWKYVHTWPNRYTADQSAGVQLVTSKSYANSNTGSLYIVYAVAVRDERVAYIELGQEASMQRQAVSDDVTVFYWDETGNWDGTDSWAGLITDTELLGTAYADDGSVLYNLTLVHESTGQDSFQWLPVE